jgi:hypothetical protein
VTLTLDQGWEHMIGPRCLIGATVTDLCFTSVSSGRKMVSSKIGISVGYRADLSACPPLGSQMTQVHNDLEIVVLQRGNSRFEWRLYHEDGTILAKGRASNVLQARSDAFRSRSQTPTVNAMGE